MGYENSTAYLALRSDLAKNSASASAKYWLRAIDQLPCGYADVVIQGDSSRAMRGFVRPASIARVDRAHYVYVIRPSTGGKHGQSRRDVARLVDQGGAK